MKSFPPLWYVCPTVTDKSNPIIKKYFNLPIDFKKRKYHIGENNSKNESIECL